jgi:cytochrome c553
MQQILATVHEESDWRAVIEFIMTLPVRRADAHAASEQHAASEPHTATDLHAAAAGERARQIYGTCAACHGIAGDGNEALQAPSLASLPAWYIAAQLHKFRKGSRGAAASDGPGRSMRAIAATLTSDRDIAAVSDYIALTLASP